MPKSINVSVRHGWQAALILPNEFFDQPVGAELAAAAVSVSSATAELTTGAGGGRYLQFPAATAYVALPSRLILNSPVTITFDIQRDADVNIYLSNDAGDELRYIVGTGWQIRISNTYYTYPESTLTPPIGERFTVTFNKVVSTAWEVSLNGGTPVSKNTQTSNLWINNIGQGVGGVYQSFRLYRLTVAHGAYPRDFDPSNTSSGTTLFNVLTNANNGTLTGAGWPSDDSEWVPYGGGGAAQLVAAATCQSTANGSLTTAIRLAAAATAIAACSAGLSTGIRLQSSAVSVSTATASLTTQAAGMTAAAVGQSSATASLTTGIRLAANAIGQSSANAQLSTGVRLVAAAVGVSSSSAALTNQIRLQANAAAQATASGTLTGVSAALSAVAVSRSTVGASLSTAIRLQASTFGGSSCSADLSTQILLQAAAYSVSEVTADLTTAGQLPPKIYANELKVTRITGAYKIEQLGAYSITIGTQRFVLQQQGNFSITNSTPRFQIERV